MISDAAAGTGGLFGTDWYKDAAYSDDWDFDSDTVNEDTILYAKWTTGMAPTITTTSLPGGTVGMIYSQTLAAAGDTLITWSIINGILPEGLALTSGGTISGIPTASGTFNFTIEAENATGSDTQDLSILISKTLLSITSPTAITGVANGTDKTASALGLPPTVTLVTNDGNVSGDVTWDVASSSYDPSDTDEQTFTVNGTVGLPSGMINPDGVSLDVTISVTVKARSGGSSSGGGGGSGSTPATQSYTADIEVTDVSGNGMKKTTLPVTVDKNAGSAAIDIVSR